MITQNLLYGALGAEYLSGIIRNIDRDQLSRLRTRLPAQRLPTIRLVAQAMRLTIASAAG